jgi:dienelactone hydrolase
VVAGEPDEVVALQDFAPQSVGAPAPLILADDLRLALAYYLSDRAGDDPDEDPVAIVFFPRYHACRFGGPNDEALEGHPLAPRGLEPYGVFEVRRSSWIAELERVNAVHERHDPRSFAALRHLVFTFHDTLFECAAPRWDTRTTRGTHAKLLPEMQALFRRDDAVVLTLSDRSRGRELPTTLYLPATTPAPLVVFAHGWFGHPRKFTRLFAAWAEAGIAVAAPAFPLTNDESPLGLDSDDVANQPRDVAFVLDELLSDDVFGGRFDRERVAVGGFSLGAMTALAIAFNAAHRDERVRAVASLAGRLRPGFGGSWELTETPLLVVHGQKDAGVPYEEARAVYDAARGPKLLLTFPDDEHDVAQDASPVLDEVIAATTAFWRLFLLDDASALERLLQAPAAGTVEAVGVARC